MHEGRLPRQVNRRWFSALMAACVLSPQRATAEGVPIDDASKWPSPEEYALHLLGMITVCRHRGDELGYHRLVDRFVRHIGDNPIDPDEPINACGYEDEPGWPDYHPNNHWRRSPQWQIRVMGELAPRGLLNSPDPTEHRLDAFGAWATAVSSPWFARAEEGSC